MKPIFAALALLCACATASADISSAVAREERGIAGLEAPAEIIVDQWGVAHVYAASERDAFFLQGWNAARDRLWQIDLWRKRGLGRLAESFGPAYVQQDRAARLFLYRGDINAEWAAYGPNARASAEAFAAGVNAYVDDVRAGRAPLPVEFTLTHSRPERWRAEDIVRIRSHALTRNASSEVERARIVCAARPEQGLEADRLRRHLEPAWETEVPAGLDPCAIPENVLADYALATRDVSFAALGPQQRAEAEPQTDLAALSERTLAQGSNNWVISPARSATGRPILANDPHRSLGVPSLRYIVHLNAPGMSVIGAGEPALPGISIGHNGAIAFGLTIFSADQEDLYIYELNPANPRQYRYNGRWENMRRIRETIHMAQSEPTRADLFFTRHGPIVHIDAENNRAFALRTVWDQPGTSAYFGSMQYMRAQDWPQFQNAMRDWGAPSENLVFASAQGDIGWVAAGRTPFRRNWDGLLPVPGDGRYEWDGFMPAEALPSVHNPAEGFFASANEMNLPPNYPINENRIGFEWSNPTRIIRIRDVLSQNASVSLADSMALQMDAFSTDACRLRNLLSDLASSDADETLALNMLKQWDCIEHVSSAPAALYEIWAARHLARAVIARATPTSTHALIGAGTIHAIIEFLESEDANPIRQPAILESLGEAISEARIVLGEDPTAWTWGAIHRAHFIPAIAPIAPRALLDQMSVGPLQVRGSSSTPAAATPRLSDGTAIAGASFRMVVDVGNWDASVAVNTPGQSGDPMSAHYRDLFPLWAAGEYFPLAYSRNAVESAARRVITLTPSR